MNEIVYVQGENGTITINSHVDMTTLVGHCRATANFVGSIVAAATDVETVIKLDSNSANILGKSPLGSGIRCRVTRTNEWLLITAVDGINATVTRAQDDP